MGRTSDAKERLMEAAGRLVHARGYNAVGVQDICREAGVRKGSFYHFFESKTDLVLAVLEINMTELEGCLAQGGDSTQPPLLRLQGFVRELRKRYSGLDSGGGERVFGCPIGNLAVEVGTLDERLRAATGRAFERIQGYVAQLLAEAVRAGDLPAHDTRQVARALVALLQGATVLAKAANDPDIVDDFIARLPVMATAISAA